MFTPLSSSVTDNSGDVSVTNETVTASYGEPVELEGYDIIQNSETVYGFNDTSDSYESVPSGDYSIDHDPGTITVDSSSTVIQDGEDVKVTYDYQATSGSSTTVLNLIPLMMALLILGVLAAAVMKRM